MSLQEDITSVRKDIEAATERLKKLEEQAKKIEPWKPKGGGWVAYPGSVKPSSCLVGDDVIRRITENGRGYTTEAQAIAAQKRIDFYARLVALATELNPSGVVGGNHGIQWDVNQQRVSILYNEGNIGLFQTSEATNKAVILINQERWFNNL